MAHDVPVVLRSRLQPPVAAHLSAHQSHQQTLGLPPTIAPSLPGVYPAGSHPMPMMGSPSRAPQDPFAGIDSTDVSNSTLPSSPASRKNKRKMVELSIDLLKEYFERPLKVVARELGVCTTFLKKQCRTLGLKRWPYRKIRGIKAQLNKLETRMDKGVPVNDADPSSTAPDPVATKRQLEAALNQVTHIGTVLSPEDVMYDPSQQQQQYEESDRESPSQSQERQRQPTEPTSESMEWEDAWSVHYPHESAANLITPSRLAADWWSTHYCDVHTTASGCMETMVGAFLEAPPNKETRTQNDEHTQWDEDDAAEMLSSLIRFNLFARPVMQSLQPSCPLMDRFDSIRGACVFAFGVSVTGVTTINFMSQGVLDVHGINPEQAVGPDGAARIIGSVFTPDQQHHAETLEHSRRTLTEWRWEGRMVTNNNGRRTIKNIHLRASPRKLVDGTVQWDGFSVEAGIVNTLSENEQRAHFSPSDLSADNVYSDIVSGPKSLFRKLAPIYSNIVGSTRKKTKPTLNLCV